MQWSKNQQQAIDARNRRILVSAAAGSGKTAVLVGRIIERILEKENPTSVNNLLIMTFTRAAARQMKERIASALEKELHKVSFQSEEYKRLKRQMALIDCANISTIDSFCKEIITQYLDKAELDPGFSIADEESLSLIKEDILEAMMEEEYERADAAFMDLASAFSTARSDGKITEYIKYIHNYAQTSAWPDAWYAKQENTVSEVLLWVKRADEGVDLQDNLPDALLWLNGVCEIIHQFAKDILQEMDTAISICRMTGGPLAYLDMILLEKSMLERVLDIHEYEKMCKMLHAIEFGRLGRVAKDVDADLKNRAKGIRDNYKKAIKNLQGNYIFPLDTILLHEQNAAKYIMELLRLTREFDRRFREAKQKKNQVDFGDLEHLALKLLYEHDEIAGYYREKFDEIYVDEYQDSNYVQEELIKAIEKNNVFMVGDVKQSIYGFRQAKPELFTSKYNAFVAYEGNEDKTEDARIDLSMNYRSRPDVLFGINALFYRIMDRPLGGISYDEAAALHAGAKYENETGEYFTSTKSEILILNLAESEDAAKTSERDGKSDSDEYGKSDSDEHGKTVLEENSKIELEAGMIAQRIKELMQTLLVRDENGENRRLRYSDIVILLRSQTNRAESMAEVLVNQAIPAFAQTSTGYFDTYEIRKILAVLTILDNPLKDIEMSAYLHSPMADISDEDMAVILTTYRNRESKSGMTKVYFAVKYYLEFGENDSLRQKLQDAMDLLQRLRKAARVEPLTILLRKIYEETKFYDYCAVRTAGDIRCANLDMLLEKADQFVQSGYQGVFHFVRYIDSLKKYSTDYGEASTIGEFDDTVRIMTIHKSKGLEFPVCFLANADKKFNEMDLRMDVLLDDDLGIACKYVDTKLRIKSDTLKKELIAYKKKSDMIAEELRVLYVAMTRAKEKLIITGTVNDVETLRNKYAYMDASEEAALSFMNIRGASSYLDWIMMCYTGISRYFSYKVYSYADLLMGEMHEQVDEAWKKEQLMAWKSNHSDLEAVDSKQHASVLQERLKFVYPFQSDTRQKGKISISELKRAGQFVDDADSEKWFADEKQDGIRTSVIASSNFAGTRRGNLYHRFMELLDFTQVESLADLEEQLQRWIKEKKIAKDAKFVSRKKIWALIRSEIGQRMKQAALEGRLYREQNFIMGIPAKELDVSDSEERILIQGIMDAFIDTDEGLILLDYKTDRLKRKPDFLKRYQVQLQYYKKALEMSFQKKVLGAYIYSFELEEMIEVV